MVTNPFDTETTTKKIKRYFFLAFAFENLVMTSSRFMVDGILCSTAMNTT